MILQQIFRLFAGSFLALCLVATSSCDRPGAAVAPAVAERLAEVVAGTGDPEASTVAAITRVVEREEPAVRALFRGLPRQRYFIHVHADREHLPAALAANLHEDSPGFAMLGTRQIHVVWGEMQRTGASLRGVVVHEMVHELLDQFVAPHGRALPRWFHEGLAQAVAGDTYLGAREDELVWRAAAGRLESFDSLRTSFPADKPTLQIAYAQSYSFVAWLVREFGMATVIEIASSVDASTSFEVALSWRTKRSSLDLNTAWQQHLLHGSGAPWRVAFDQFFSLLMIGALPVLVLALMRRLAVDRRAARRLEAAAAAEDEAVSATITDGTDDEITSEEPGEERRSAGASEVKGDA